MARRVSRTPRRAACGTRRRCLGSLRAPNDASRLAVAAVRESVGRDRAAPRLMARAPPRAGPARRGLSLECRRALASVAGWLAFRCHRGAASRCGRCVAWRRARRDSLPPARAGAHGGARYCRTGLASRASCTISGGTGTARGAARTARGRRVARLTRWRWRRGTLSRCVSRRTPSRRRSRSGRRSRGPRSGPRRDTSRRARATP